MITEPELEVEVDTFQCCWIFNTDLIILPLSIIINYITLSLS